MLYLFKDKDTNHDNIINPGAKQYFQETKRVSFLVIWKSAWRLASPYILPNTSFSCHPIPPPGNTLAAFCNLVNHWALPTGSLPKTEKLSNWSFNKTADSPPSRKLWWIWWLVGGFNPSEKYKSNWKSSPSRGENKKYLKPPPRIMVLVYVWNTFFGGGQWARTGGTFFFAQIRYENKSPRELGE